MIYLRHVYACAQLILLTFHQVRLYVSERAKKARIDLWIFLATWYYVFGCKKENLLTVGDQTWRKEYYVINNKCGNSNNI